MIFGPETMNVYIYMHELLQNFLGMYISNHSSHDWYRCYDFARKVLYRFHETLLDVVIFGVCRSFKGMRFVCRSFNGILFFYSAYNETFCVLGVAIFSTGSTTLYYSAFKNIVLLLQVPIALSF